MEIEDELYELLRSDPEAAWPRVLDFASKHPESASASALIEDFVYLHNDRFISRLEEAVLHDPILREIVEQAYVGGDASVGAEQFNRLQDRLRSESGW